MRRNIILFTLSLLVVIFLFAFGASGYHMGELISMSWRFDEPREVLGLFTRDLFICICVVIQFCLSLLVFLPSRPKLSSARTRYFLIVNAIVSLLLCFFLFAGIHWGKAFSGNYERLRTPDLIYWVSTIGWVLVAIGFIAAAIVKDDD